MNINRRLVLGLGLGAAAVSMAGCNSSGGSDEGAVQGEVPTSGTLTVWCWDPAFNIYSMNEAAKIYQKAHPDVQVKVVETPWDDIQTKLTTLAQSDKLDQLPDIFLCQNNAFQKNVINYPDAFSNLTKGGVKFSDFPEAVTAYSTVDGANYGVPFDNGTAVQALRIDYLEQAGMTMKDFTDITWTDYIERGKALKAKTGKAMISGESGSSDLIMMMLQSAGASLFDGDGKPTIANNEVLLKSIDVLKQLQAAGLFVEVNSWDEYIRGFISGNHASALNGVWILGSVQTATDQSGKWEITNVPKLDGVDGATNYTANGGSSWAVSAGKQPALANDFLKATFAGSTELYDTILPKAGALANWTPAAKSTVYQEKQKFFNDTAIYAQVVDYSTKVPKNNTGAYYYEGRDAASVAMTKILKGADPKAALEEAQKTVEFAMQ
ncbi:ABC transporter substrate-binding protein [Aestuariimicrobium soli]|uniref:ABC transporter substrate-binding protein n=1 Tax=Aestuariimicrobium soli TaxID=2035834 RepID=UPI003EB96D98